MNNNIHTHEDLMAEKARLESALEASKYMIRKDISEFTDKLLPVSETLSSVSKLFKRDRHNPIVNAGVNLAGDVILKKFVLARTGWITKLVVPFLVKNYSSHLLNKTFNKKTNNIFHKIAERLKGTTHTTAKV